MYSYEERIRAVNLYIKLGKRLQAALPASEANHDGRSPTAHREAETAKAHRG